MFLVFFFFWYRAFVFDFLHGFLCFPEAKPPASRFTDLGTWALSLEFRVSVLALAWLSLLRAVSEVRASVGNTEISRTAFRFHIFGRLSGIVRERSSRPHSSTRACNHAPGTHSNITSNACHTSVASPTSTGQEAPRQPASSQTSCKRSPLKRTATVTEPVTVPWVHGSCHT